MMRWNSPSIRRELADHRGRSSTQHTAARQPQRCRRACACLDPARLVARRGLTLSHHAAPTASRCCTATQPAPRRRRARPVVRRTAKRHRRGRPGAELGVGYVAFMHRFEPTYKRIGDHTEAILIEFNEARHVRGHPRSRRTSEGARLGRRHMRQYRSASFIGDEAQREASETMHRPAYRRRVSGAGAIEPSGVGAG